MSAHTPGPWGVERDGVTVWMGNQIVGTAIAPDGAKIAEQRANAALIAAAPDLLAALHAVRNQIACNPVASDISHAVWIAETAIARAEGR